MLFTHKLISRAAVQTASLTSHAGLVFWDTSMRRVLEETETARAGLDAPLFIINR